MRVNMLVCMNHMYESYGPIGVHVHVCTYRYICAYCCKEGRVYHISMHACAVESHETNAGHGIEVFDVSVNSMEKQICTDVEMKECF